jgi:hypothetical protein
MSAAAAPTAAAPAGIAADDAAAAAAGRGGHRVGDLIRADHARFKALYAEYLQLPDEAGQRLEARPAPRASTARRPRVNRATPSRAGTRGCRLGGAAFTAAPARVSSAGARAAEVRGCQRTPPPAPHRSQELAHGVVRELSMHAAL